MTIEITLDNDAWIRADLIDFGKPSINLYHAQYQAHRPLLGQYADAVDYVKFHLPQYNKVRIVNDLGSHTCTL